MKASQESDATQEASSKPQLNVKKPQANRKTGKSRYPARHVPIQAKQKPVKAKQQVLPARHKPVNKTQGNGSSTESLSVNQTTKPTSQMAKYAQQAINPRSHQVAQMKCADCAEGKKRSESRANTGETARVVQRKSPEANQSEAEQLAQESYPERVIGDAKAFYKDMKASVNKKLNTSSVALLNPILPIGRGISFDFHGGVTWGIPVHTGAKVTCELKRLDAKRLHLLVYKQGILAGDTGVGASLMIRKPGSFMGEHGIGGEAGMHAQGGVQGTQVEEYILPVQDFLAFAGKAWVKTALNIGTSQIGVAVNQSLNKNSNQYLVRQRFEAGVFAQGNTEAGLGVRTATNDFQNKTKKGYEYGGAVWNRKQDRKHQGTKPRLVDGDLWALANRLGLFVSQHMRGQVVLGFEQKREEDKTIMSLYGEGEVSALVKLPIPFLNQLLQMLPSGVGAGFRLDFVQQKGKKEWKVRPTIYQKQGEDQKYAGNANQQELEFNLDNLISTDELLKQMQQGKVKPLKALNPREAIEGIKFSNRILLTQAAGGRLGSFLRRQRGARSLLTDKNQGILRNSGISLGVYLDLEFELDKADFDKITEILSTKGKKAAGVAKNAQSFKEAYQLIKKFALDEATSPETWALVKEVGKVLMVKKALLRFQGNVGVGISGKLGAGAKVRGDLSVQGGMFCELDYIKEMNKGKAMGVTQLMQGLPKVLDDPETHLSDCPLVAKAVAVLKRTWASKKGKAGASTKKTKRRKSVKRSKRDDKKPGRGDKKSRVRVTGQIPKDVSQTDISVSLLYNKITADSPVGFEDDMYIIIGAPYHYKVPVKMRVKANDKEKLVLELVNSFWIKDTKIGSRAGQEYTVDKQ